MSNPGQRHPRYLVRDQLDALRADLGKRDGTRFPERSLLSRILVPLDGSEHAERILSLVRGLLAGRGIEVMLLRVLGETAIEPGRPSPVEVACAELDALRRALLATGADVRYDLMTGDPAERILLFAESYRPSLIAMATHGRRGISRLVNGSVTEHLLRHADFPVLAVSPPGLEEIGRPLSLRTILVPLDGSERSAAILPLATELARRHASSVTLLHVVEPIGLPVELQLYDLTPEEGTAVAEPWRLVLREAGVAANGLVVRGRAAPAILKAARDERADLIAMATHGRTGLSRLVFGSAAEEVLRRAPCPVLLERSVERIEEEEEAAARIGSVDDLQA